MTLIAKSLLLLKVTKRSLMLYILIWEVRLNAFPRKSFFFYYYKQFIIVKLLKIIFAGIFAYLNYLTPKSRKEILELLIGGLKRLEYRGYDSAGKKKNSCFRHYEFFFFKLR